MIVECSGMENGKKSMEGSMGGTRFWEFYLVRYLLGTIFGIVILFYLVINYDGLITKAFYPKSDFLCAECDVAGCQSIKDDVKSLLFSTTYGLGVDDANSLLKTIGSNHLIDAKNENIEITETGFPILAAIILAVSGFLYMYFSSMLILILHGIRSLIFFYPPKSWTKYVGIVFFVGFLSYISWIFTPMLMDGKYADHWRNNKHLIAISIIVGLILLLLFSSRLIQEFYEKLSKFRTNNEDIARKSSVLKMRVTTGETHLNKESLSEEQKDDQIKDYIESYKHLREHGNAFGIIVCEIVFAFWLYIWDFEFWAVLYWCILGFMAWFLGSYLEIRGVSTKNK
jgi:hypothetical protein